tara:strand:+ start:187 stop:315 length:129 start_codon:yes stop_codon:yes gene_type:complete
MKTGVTGLQYVGLFAVVFFMRINLGTICVDIDQSNIDKLKNR